MMRLIIRSLLVFAALATLDLLVSRSGFWGGSSPNAEPNGWTGRSLRSDVGRSEGVRDMDAGAGGGSVEWSLPPPPPVDLSAGEEGQPQATRRPRVLVVNPENLARFPALPRCPFRGSRVHGRWRDPSATAEGLLNATTAHLPRLVAAFRQCAAASRGGVAGPLLAHAATTIADFFSSVVPAAFIREYAGHRSFVDPANTGDDDDSGGDNSRPEQGTQGGKATVRESAGGGGGGGGRSTASGAPCRLRNLPRDGLVLQYMMNFGAALHQITTALLHPGLEDPPLRHENVSTAPVQTVPAFSGYIAGLDTFAPLSSRAGYLKADGFDPEARDAFDRWGLCEKKMRAAVDELEGEGAPLRAVHHSGKVVAGLRGRRLALTPHLEPLIELRQVKRSPTPLATATAEATRELLRSVSLHTTRPSLDAVSLVHFGADSSVAATERDVAMYDLEVALLELRERLVPGTLLCFDEFSAGARWALAQWMATTASDVCVVAAGPLKGGRRTGDPMHRRPLVIQVSRVGAQLRRM